MESVRIVVLCVVAAVVYGLIHDQITARICLEYFTVFHPRVVESDSPTVQGLVWGVIATWWVGAFFGSLLAMAARIGRWPKVTAAELLWPVIKVGLFAAASAFVAGLIALILSYSGWIWIAPFWARQIPEKMHDRFLVAAWAHAASYLVGSIGAIVLIAATLLRRRRLHLGRG